MSDARWDGYVAEGRKAVRQRDDAQWRLGDLAIEVQTTYGEKDCERYADVIGVEYEALREYRRIARRYENARRLAFLPWSMFQTFAAQDDRAELIQRASEHKWTVREARAFLEERRTAEQPAPPANPLERLMQSDSYKNALAEQAAAPRRELDGPKARLGAKGALQIPNLDIKLERYRAETAWYDESCDIEALTYMDTRALARTGEMAIAVWTEMLDRIARAHRAAAS